jgi:hypothetical protein
MDSIRFLLSLLLYHAATFSATDSSVVECLVLPGISQRIELKASPLIGGPTWLPLHCKVVVGDGGASVVFDYVPRDPTSAETLQKLIMLQRVPAEARITRTSTRWNDAKNSGKGEGSKVPIIGPIRDDDDGDSTTELYVRRAVDFCRSYDKDLHLLHNNCWTFAFDLILCIVRADHDTTQTRL